ncbi:Uncharacterized protein Fot_21706 [Forsythia ovata]|uniref:Uncharacterized protein n=1 Tax=Forsythia ovata TaxID=205694 RepID=A0ABD1UVM4_9LAMI
MNPLAFNYTGSPNGGGTDLAEERDRVVVEDGQDEEVGVQVLVEAEGLVHRLSVLAEAEGLVHRLSVQIKLAEMGLRLGSRQEARRGWRVRPKQRDLREFQQRNYTNFLIF